MKWRRIDQYVARLHRLLAATLRGGIDDDKAWRAIKMLHYSGNRLIFTKANAWCSSSQALKRGRGVDILAQLRTGASRNPRSWGKSLCRKESVVIIRQMLKTEADFRVIASAVSALGHLEDLTTVDLIVSFANHHDPDIRFSVAVALGGFHFHDQPASVAAAMHLMNDPDKDVRNWAIFGVGTQGNADSDELRNILATHLTDSYFDARLEAIEALAKRHDLRALKPLLRHFELYGDILSLCDAAHSFLSMEQSPNPHWTAKQYLATLRETFSAEL